VGKETVFINRQVHPYLQYRILIGERKHNTLPGWLFRHGTQFDFMLSWIGSTATEEEMSDFYRRFDERNTSIANNAGNHFRQQKERPSPLHGTSQGVEGKMIL
jgi:hypothetical protein